MSDEPKTQLAKKDDAPITKIRHLLESKKSDLVMALPKHLTVDRLLRVSLTACNKTPKLMDCTPQSLLACIMDCASLGLEPDSTLGRAYLIPYGDKATLIIGYKGLVDLAYRSGMVDSLDAFVVHANDKFALKMGLNPDIQHEPAMEEPGELSGVYAIARLKGSTFPKFCYLTRKEVDAIRKRSRAKESGPWVTDYEEMAKKTAIRRLSKLLPMSVEFADAINKDAEYDFDEVPQIHGKKPLFPSGKAPNVVVIPPEQLETTPPPAAAPEPTPAPENAPKKPTLVEEPLDKPEPAAEGPGKSGDAKTETMTKLCKEHGIKEKDALAWLGESGCSSFADMPDHLFKMIVSQPKQFKTTVEEMRA